MKKTKKTETSKDVQKRLDKRKQVKHKLNISIVVFIVLSLISLVPLYLGFKKQSTYTINKIEKSVTDYKVYMNKDEIYTKDFQESGYGYISSTIDYVKANYNYELKFNKDAKTKYDYEVKSILTIKEPGIDGSVLYTKEFQEMDKKADLIAEKDLILNEEVNIDYKKYNGHVENYKQNYGVSVDASVKTVMYITEKTMYDGREIFKEVRELSTTIPLGEHTLDIKVNNPINSVVELTGESKLKLDFVYVGLGGILVLMAIVYIIKTIVLLNSYEGLKTPYDARLAKILKEYDRIVVETDVTKIGQNFKNEITVNEFDELVDVRDNTEQPILYVERKIGKQADFMVINDETVYVYHLEDK